VTLPKGRVQRSPRLSIFPRLVRARRPALPPQQLPCPSPSGRPKGRLVGKLAQPARLPTNLLKALPKPVRLALPLQRP